MKIRGKGTVFNGTVALNGWRVIKHAYNALKSSSVSLV